MPKRSATASGSAATFAAGFLSDAKGASELTKRLKQVHQALKEVSQDAAEKPEALASELISRRLLQHTDRVIVMFSTCRVRH